MARQNCSLTHWPCPRRGRVGGANRVTVRGTWSFNII